MCCYLFGTRVSADTFMSGLWNKLRERGVPKYAIPRLVRVEKQQHDFLFENADVRIDECEFQTQQDSVQENEI